MNLIDTKYMQNEARLKANASLKSIDDIHKNASTSMTKMGTPESMITPTRKMSTGTKCINTPIDSPIQISMKMNILPHHSNSSKNEIKKMSSIY